jgi:hypothetical protein
MLTYSEWADGDPLLLPGFAAAGLIPVFFSETNNFVQEPVITAYDRVTTWYLLA